MKFSHEWIEKNPWLLIGLVLLVMGGIYVGWFTPTEAGAAGAFGALAIGLVRRSLSLRGIVLSIIESVRISAMMPMERS